MPPQPPHPDDLPDFRDWADHPANADELNLLIAHFLAEEGVEMLGDLVACRGQQHQWAAERWIARLAERFAQWWAQGRPRLSSPQVKVTHWTIPQEAEARGLLESSLPPGAAFGLTRRWKKLAGGGSEPAGWACRIEDGRATAMGQGASPAAAAGQAIDAWREFVTASRAGVVEEHAHHILPDRPSLLDAPSAGPEDEPGQAGKEAV